MIEFKFPCPNCSQHIQCNDAYIGRQIICPTCKNQIVVPPASSALEERTVVPPSQVHAQKPVTSPTPSQRSTPRGKSKNKLVAVTAAIAVTILGICAYLFSTGSEEPTVQQTMRTEEPSSQKNRSDNVSIPVVAPKKVSDLSAPSASEIQEKVTARYASLTNYSAKGRAISVVDMSGVDPSNLPGAASKEIGDSKSAEFKLAMRKPQRSESDFAIKLGRPDFYRIEWEGQMGATRSKGAVWSSGDGDFLLREMGQTKYVKMKTRPLALAAATGISAGAANTLPQIFFNGQSSLLNLLKDVKRNPDETLADIDCYVVSGNAMGTKVLLWIDKNSYLIRQKQQILGGDIEIPEMTEDRIEEGLKQLGSNPTEQQRAQMKESMKNMKTLTSQMKGTITETYEEIEIDQQLSQTDFNHPVPPGIKLSESLF